MAALSIRKLDDDVKERLRRRAASHGRSMEAEVRRILIDAVRDQDESPELFGALMDQVGALGGVELDLPARSTSTRAADLSA